jgi:hypothetical protein
MTEFINRAYVAHYVEKAQSTENEQIKKDALYRVGTHIEVLECDGNASLTPEQQHQILQAAQEVLGGEK